MLCYDCCQEGGHTEAAGVCHHCSAGLGVKHIHAVTDPVRMRYPVVRTVELPMRARLILCETCLSALSQEHDPSAETGREEP
jgi:hypothetical protein